MKESLNIILYVNNFLPKIGGREMVVFYLANALHDMGHRVRILGPHGFWRCRNIHFQYPVHRWPSLLKLFKDQVSFLQLLVDTAIWGCDIIHAHNTYPTGYAASWLKLFRKLPLIITPHGEDIQTIPEINFGMRLNNKLCKKIGRALKRADLITAISKNVEDAIIDSGVPIGKIRKIPNGVDIERFQKNTFTDMRQWLGLPANTKLILTVGNYERRRGQEELVSAMPAILSLESMTRLVIVGKSTEVLHPLIQELSLDDYVVLTGPILPIDMTGNKKDLLANIYRSSDVYVSAGVAENAEGLSLALLDGIAAGLPIVATNISGNRDVIKDRVNGYLVKPSDSGELAKGIHDILRNKDVQKKFSDESLRISKQYAWHEIASRYLEIYHEILSD